MSFYISCFACSYSVELNDATQVKIKENFTIKKIEKKILENEMKFGNKSEIECPKCGHNEALFKEVQTRSADEPMTIFYKCCKCENNWKI